MIGKVSARLGQHVRRGRYRVLCQPRTAGDGEMAQLARYKGFERRGLVAGAKPVVNQQPYERDSACRYYYQDYGKPDLGLFCHRSSHYAVWSTRHPDHLIHKHMLSLGIIDPFDLFTVKFVRGKLIPIPCWRTGSEGSRHMSHAL